MLTLIIAWIMNHKVSNFDSFRWVLCWAMFCDVLIVHGIVVWLIGRI